MAHYKASTIKELRKYQYDFRYKTFPYLKDWKKNPYTFLKARFYIELSTVLVFLLLKTKIKPNTITIIYGVAGITGGVLLALANKYTILVAIFIFFTKGILDWGDGHLARLTGRTSITGHVLDLYGALLNDLGFQIGLGFYVAFQTDVIIFFYLIPLIPFFHAAQLKSYSQKVLFSELSNKEVIRNRIQKSSQSPTDNPVSKKNDAFLRERYFKLFKFFSAFLDARARSVDFICLLILIEMYASVSVTWIIFIVFVIKGFLLFLGGYYITLKKDWIEKSLDATLHNIRNTFMDNK